MSGFVDTTMGVRAIGTRTDSAGSGITDISAEEDRFANIFVAEGYISPVNAFAVAADTSWNLDVGSGTTKTDYYVIEGQGVGQGNYVIRLDEAGEVVTVDASDVSNPRIDEVYLVVMDNAYDASGLVLPRLAVREGDTGPSPTPPGPDPSWLAYAVLAEILIPAGSADITEATVTDLRIQSQSNVDAPTLEGNAAAAFSTVSHNHAALYTPLSHVNSPDGHPDAGASDGMMSATQKLKLNAIQTSADQNLTPSEILTLIKTVDASGSLIDADTVDGSHANAFSTSGHTHDSTHYTEAESNALRAAKAGVPQHVAIHRAPGADIAIGSGYESGTMLYYLERSDDWNGHVFLGDVITSGPPGYYLIEAQVTFSVNSNGYRFLRIHKSGGAGDLAYARQAGTANEDSIVRVATAAIIRSGETISMYIKQTSGSTLNYEGGTTWLQMTYLGATP
jgi:hypothetical protein